MVWCTYAYVAETLFSLIAPWGQRACGTSVSLSEPSGLTFSLKSFNLATAPMDVSRSVYMVITYIRPSAKLISVTRLAPVKAVFEPSCVAKVTIAIARSATMSRSTNPSHRWMMARR